MNWFKKIVCRWVREDWEETRRAGRANYVSEAMPRDVSSDIDGASGDPVLNFRVYSAVGGRIVEFRRYDPRQGNNEFTSYIISEDQDFGSRIAKIATMENLKA